MNPCTDPPSRRWNKLGPGTPELKPQRRMLRETRTTRPVAKFWEDASDTRVWELFPGAEDHGGAGEGDKPRPPSYFKIPSLGFVEDHTNKPGLGPLQGDTAAPRQFLRVEWERRREGERASERQRGERRCRISKMRCQKLPEPRERPLLT